MLGEVERGGVEGGGGGYDKEEENHNIHVHKNIKSKQKYTLDGLIEVDGIMTQHRLLEGQGWSVIRN